MRNVREEGTGKVEAHAMEWVACNLCGSNDGELLYPSPFPNTATSSDGITAYRCTSTAYSRHYPIQRCRHCGLVYANPRPDEGEVLRAYQEVVDPLYLQEEAGRRLTFQRYVRAIEDVVGPPCGRRLLDVGCYTGLFPAAAQERGWEAWGVDPCRWAVEEGLRRGVTILQGTLRGLSLPADSFDVVTLWDVAEHLADPRATFGEAWRVLKPRGWIIIQTMNIRSWLAQLMGPYWPWLMEMHLYYFSPHTLACMLQQVGFEPVRTARLGRYLRLSYLASRLSSASPRLAQGLQCALWKLRLARLPIFINAADLFTFFARKVEEGV
jgi:ubiquinone/menaquinone biosynthesis C-methylase UbiE